jgi:serine/threonine protein kinase
MDSRIGQPIQGYDRQSHRLLGNYRIIRLLGQGGFADVYLGEHIHLRTQAAIKVLQVRLVESNIQSFLNEARTIAHLVHPYIIRVLDFGVEASTPFLVMDYAPRGTFRQRFLQGKPLPPTALFPYIKQAAAALQYAHDKKLIHRDVKPENMLLGPSDEVLLSDFGFALMQTSIPRVLSETAGTASYMAPEQLEGKPQPASDQYSLGIIAYEWLAGTCPFQGNFMEIASQHMLTEPPSLVERVPGLSTEVARVVMTALEKEPDRRFPSVSDFAQALEHACLTTRSKLASSTSIVPPPFLANTGISGTGVSPIPTGNAQALSSSFETLQPGKTFRPPSPSASFPPVLSNTFQPLPSNWQATKSSVSSTGQTAANGPTTEDFSQSGLRPLQSQARSELTSSTKLSPLKSSEQSFPPAPSRSHPSLPALPELLPLPQQPFLGPELAGQSQSMPIPRISQTFSALQNTSVRTRPQSLGGLPPLNRPDRMALNEPPSLSSASGPKTASRSTQLVKSEDFWKLSKSTTPITLYFFIIFMVALIIGSTAILITLTNNQNNGSTSKAGNAQAPTTHATATSASQTPGTMATTQTEPNPYGSHNGTLVLNSPLSQQDQQMQWDESNSCAFADQSYHVVADDKQNFTLCDANGLDYGNFVYQVQMTFTHATSAVGSGGLVFRASKASQQFYFFEIFTTGEYNFYSCPGPDGGNCPTLSTSTGGPIASLHKDLGQPNTIAVVANGNTFSIYVNNILAVDTVTDSNSSHGMIGMMARQDNQNAVTDVSFNNLKIWQL